MSKAPDRERELAEERSRLQRIGGSFAGRERYAAAMALYQAGEIGPKALEVFRICARRDETDPMDILQDRGLALSD